jgi:hypothetical protein
LDLSSENDLALLFNSKASRLSFFCPRLLYVLNVVREVMMLLSVFQLNLRSLWR